MVTVQGVEIARVQTVYASGSDGEPFTITREILASVAEAHSRLENHVVPIAKGHWFADDAPALGRLENLRVVGDSLLADFVNVPESTAEEIRAGQYPNRSIGLIGCGEIAGEIIPWHLDHLALLGAAQPAVAGMTPLYELFSAERGDIAPVLALSRGNPIRRERLGTHSNPEGEPMSAPKDIREALGLSEDASDKDVLAKVAMLREASEKAPENPEGGDEVEVDEAEVEAEAEQVAVLASKQAAEILNLQAETKRLRTREEERDRVDVVRAARDAGKLVEAEEAQWLKFGKDYGTDALKEAIGHLGQALPDGERGTSSTRLSKAVTDEAVLDDYLLDEHAPAVYLSMHGHEMPADVRKARAYDKAKAEGLQLQFARPKGVN